MHEIGASVRMPLTEAVAIVPQSRWGNPVATETVGTAQALPADERAMLPMSSLPGAMTPGSHHAGRERFASDRGRAGNACNPRGDGPGEQFSEAARMLPAGGLAERSLPPNPPCESGEENVAGHNSRANAGHEPDARIPPGQAAEGESLAAELELPVDVRARGDAPPVYDASHIADTIVALMALQRRRRFCIISQSRCDRSVEAFLVQVRHRADADRKTLFAEAGKLRRAVEAGTVHAPDVADAVRASLAGRQSWDNLRVQTEREMRRLARALPGYAFVQGVRGFGDLGFGIIVGEAGDLGAFPTKGHLWKRLGLALVGDIRQQRRSNAEEAAAHGYSPSRRAEIWTVADSMFRAQWRGAKPDAPAHALGPYGEIYGRRKAWTAETHPDWSPAHRDADARRIMAKALIKHLRQAWMRDLRASKMIEAAA
jgi:hypothetical protein